MTGQVVTQQIVDGIPTEGIGVGGLLVLLFIMLATGRLYTSKQVEGIKAAAAENIADARADRDVWRDMALDSKGLVTTLLAGQETTNRLLRSIPHVEDHE